MSTDDTPTARNKMPTVSEIGDRDLTSLQALVAYIAYTKNMSESTLAEMLKAHLNITDLADVSSHSYDQAIQFLVDIQPDLAMN